MLTFCLYTCCANLLRNQYKHVTFIFHTFHSTLDSNTEQWRCENSDVSTHARRTLHTIQPLFFNVHAFVTVNIIAQGYLRQCQQSSVLTRGLRLKLLTWFVNSSSRRQNMGSQSPNSPILFLVMNNWRQCSIKRD